MRCAASNIHSYLTYLRDRLLLARELLSESGSVFVQISDENLHHVREIMDEVFGVDNFVSVIVVQKTGGQTTELLANIADYGVWYAKDKPHMKYHQLYRDKVAGEGHGSGERYNLMDEDGRYFQWTALVSNRPPGSFPVQFRGSEWKPSGGYWKTGESGFPRLIKAGRVASGAKTLRYKRYLDDFPAFQISNVWTDVAGSPDKVYVVQTATAVIQRCMLMTTDPGDLVLDPTCGSGTTAFVAEKWGRRWITCDTSRVAVTLAKQRLMTSSYDYFDLKYLHEGLKGGFVFKTVPHVTLKSIANNPDIDSIYERMHPAVEQLLTNQRLQGMLTLHRVDITRMLGGLVQQGFLESDGIGRGTRYVVPGEARPLTLEAPRLSDGAYPPNEGAPPLSEGAPPLSQPSFPATPSELSALVEGEQLWLQATPVRVKKGSSRLTGEGGLDFEEEVG